MATAFMPLPGHRRPRAVTAACVLVLATLTPPAHARVDHVDARWEELSRRIVNRQTTVFAADGSAIASGAVQSVEADRLVILPGTTQPPRSIPRASVARIEYQQTRGIARAVWTVSLALAGAAIGLLIGAVETFGEDGGPAAVATAGGATAAGAAAGYAIGSRRDRRTVVIHVTQ